MDERVRELVIKIAQSAARQGLGVDACPYKAQRTPQERTLARLWVASYLAAKPPGAGAVNFTE
jgi:hypothetical protein